MLTCKLSFLDVLTVRISTANHLTYLSLKFQHLNSFLTTQSRQDNASLSQSALLQRCILHLSYPCSDNQPEQHLRHRRGGCRQRLPLPVGPPLLFLPRLLRCHRRLLPDKPGVPVPVLESLDVFLPGTSRQGDALARRNLRHDGRWCLRVPMPSSGVLLLGIVRYYPSPSRLVSSAICTFHGLSICSRFYYVSKLFSTHCLTCAIDKKRFLREHNYALSVGHRLPKAIRLLLSGR